MTFFYSMSMKKILCNYVKRFFILFFLFSSLYVYAGGNEQSVRASIAHHIDLYYAEQLTNPQKKSRKSMAQFGYNLSYFAIPTLPITEFINPSDFGIHSYSESGRKEKNGSLYTCRGGFIDFSHMRAAADWTVYLAFTILKDPGDLTLAPEAGTLKLHFTNTDELSIEDIAGMAQRIAFERLEWHEVASWHYHHPYHIRSDQQSSFTPEDTYSNFLGTEIGRRIVLRIINHSETRPYEDIATEEIADMISSLEPVAGKNESKKAYDIVDRYKQLKLPADERNNDVWWDSNIIFRDQRYVFKRDINPGPQIDPWLVPESDMLGCPLVQSPEIFSVPSVTRSGISYYNYFTFTITPDSAMFYGRNNKLVHIPFSAFTTDHYPAIVSIIAQEMEKIFHAGFDQRDCCDPVSDFKNLRRVGLAAVLSKI
jgi:hypothetical protein